MGALYEADFYGWAIEQAESLRQAGRARLNTPKAVDWENVAEELDGLARSEARELRSRYKTLLIHLLKWRHQPKRRTRSWEVSIGRERDEIPLHLAENPGLVPRVEELFATAYGLARREAARQTRLPLAIFPEAPPFTPEQALRDDFWPD
jgi:hypothetical protein